MLADDGHPCRGTTSRLSSARVKSGRLRSETKVTIRRQLSAASSGALFRRSRITVAIDLRERETTRASARRVRPYPERRTMRRRVTQRAECKRKTRTVAMTGSNGALCSNDNLNRIADDVLASPAPAVRRFEQLAAALAPSRSDVVFFNETLE